MAENLRAAESLLGDPEGPPAASTLPIGPGTTASPPEGAAASSVPIKSSLKGASAGTTVVEGAGASACTTVVEGAGAAAADANPTMAKKTRARTITLLAILFQSSCGITRLN